MVAGGMAAPAKKGQSTNHGSGGWRRQTAVVRSGLLGGLDHIPGEVLGLFLFIPTALGARFIGPVSGRFLALFSVPLRPRTLNDELTEALAEIKQLRGIVLIYSVCRRA